MFVELNKNSIFALDFPQRVNKVEPETEPTPGPNLFKRF